MAVLERETARLAASGANVMPARFAVRALLHAATAHVLVSNIDVEIACDLVITEAMQRNAAFSPSCFLEVARQVVRE